MATTATQEIPREEWHSFFNVFSKEHEGWLVTVELFDAEIGDQVEANRMRLEGISFESPANEQPSIAIMLGATRDGHVTHMVPRPLRVRLERSELDTGVFETLQIESEEGPTTLVRFHAGVAPGD